MQTHTSADSGDGTYLVTCDVRRRLQHLRSGRLRIPGQECQEFGDFEDRFFAMVKTVLPDVTIREIDMDVLMRELEEHAREISSRVENSVVLSICSDIADVLNSRTLSINRLFDEQGEFMAHGPRPGFDDLNVQLYNLRKSLNWHRIILVEDGAYTGQTLCFTLRKLRECGWDAAVLLVGFCCARAERHIRREFDGELIILKRIPDLHDWIPARDLVPFIPHSGRVLGMVTPDGCVPFRNEQGISYAYPYILPFGKFGKWTSLPDSVAKELSRFCLKADIALFKCIERRNNRQILISDLVRNPKVSLPIIIGSRGNFPPLDLRAVEYLEQALVTV